MSKKENKSTEVTTTNLSIKRFKNADTVKKIETMRMIGIDLTDFVEWAILNFDVKTYLKVMSCKR